jgi:O-antigen ligase
MSVALVRPGTAVGLAVLLAFAPLVDGGTTYPGATVIRLGALALALAWLWGALRPGGRWRRSTPLDLPVMLFLGLAAASTLASADFYQSLQAFLTLASAALVFGVAAEATREPRAARLVVGTVVAGGLAQAGLALVQAAAGEAPRPAGTYFNPNHLALALGMTGALLLALEPPRWTVRAARWAGLGLTGAALVATGSRGGVMAAAVGWGLVAWRRWRWRAAAPAAALALALVVVPNPLARRVRALDAHDPYAYTRTQIWRSAVDRALDHPLGVGLNLFRQSSQRYAFALDGGVARFGKRAESAHNDYLQVFAELGVPGLLLAAWALASLAALARRALRAARDDGGPAALGAAGALAAVAAQGLVDTPLHVPGVLVPAAALAGLLASRLPARDAPRVPAFGGTTRARVALVVAGVVAAAGVTRHGFAYLAYRQGGEAAAAGGPLAALPWFQRAERLAPESAVYAEGVGAAALAAWKASGDPKWVVVAEEAMRRARLRDRLDARRAHRLAALYRDVVPPDPTVRRRALDQALALYEEAERLDPYAAVYPFERGEVLLLLGEQEAAARAASRAVELEPNFLAARLVLARLHAARGDRAAATEEYAAIERRLAAADTARPAGAVADHWLLAVDRAAVMREAAAARRRVR